MKEIKETKGEEKVREREMRIKEGRHLKREGRRCMVTEI